MGNTGLKCRHKISIIVQIEMKPYESSIKYDELLKFCKERHVKILFRSRNVVLIEYVNCEQHKLC